MSKRFVIFVIDTKSNTGSSDEMVAIDAFNDSLRTNGQWIFACGISDPTHGNIIDNRADAGIETGKALFEGSENYSGFWVVQANDVDIAKRLAFEGSKACNRKVELRPLLG